MSSPPWPRSMATATTSRPVSLPIQLIATEVSRPPEYARMTRSDIDQSPLVGPLLQVLDGGGQLDAGHRLARYHQDGVVAGDGADHIGQCSAVDRTGQIVRRAGRGAQHREVAAGV